jgi:glycerophosphoryl diester phosphodiesterase
VFDLFSESAGQLYLEMKCAGADCEILARKCVELIREYSFTDRVVVECFDLAGITHIKRFDSNVMTAALFEPRLKRPTSLLQRMVMVEKARDCQADEIALHHTLVAKRVVDRARKMNIGCVVWTVDRPRWFQRAASLGLKAVITNNPATMIRAIAD